LIIGGYNLEKYSKKGHKMIWNSLANKNYWTLNLIKVELES
jgi:hypothetical protein